MFEEFKGHDIGVYASYLADNSDVLKSASGGVATAMSRQMLKNGGVVAGVAYTSDFHNAEYVIVDKEENLEILRGSKVFMPKQNDVQDRIRGYLEKSIPVLFFGLPCTVAALKKKFEPELMDKLILCELICSGRTSRKVHEEYIKHIEKQFGSNVTSFNVRGKKDSWLPEYIIASFANGKVFKFPFKQTVYGQGFKVLKDEACLSCKFKGNNRQGDIMIGDFWGATQQDLFWNDCGVSVVFAETKKGNDFFTSVEELNSFETSFEKAVEGNPSVIRPAKAHEERSKVYSFFKSEGLFAAMNKTKVMKRIQRNHLLSKYHLDWLRKFYLGIKKVIK